MGGGRCGKYSEDDQERVVRRRWRRVSKGWISGAGGSGAREERTGEAGTGEVDRRGRDSALGRVWRRHSFQRCVRPAVCTWGSSSAAIDPPSSSLQV